MRISPTNVLRKRKRAGTEECLGPGSGRGTWAGEADCDTDLEGWTRRGRIGDDTTGKPL